MNFRLTGILFILAVLLVAGLVVMNFLEGDSASDASIGTLGEPLAKIGIKEEKIATVELLRTQPGEEKLVFTKSGDKWELQQPIKAKVDSNLVKALVRDVYAARPIRYNGPLDNLAIHELDKPNFRITLSDSENHSITINIGRSIPGAGSATVFVTTGEKPKASMAVRQSDLSSLYRESGKDGSAWQLTKWLTDYRQKKLFGSDTMNPNQDVEGIKMAYVNKGFHLQRKANTWTFTDPAGYGEADEVGDSGPRANNSPLTGVNPLLTLLGGLQVSSNEDIIEKPADLGVYGLKSGDPNLMQVELAYKNGTKDVVHFGKIVEEKGTPVVPTKVFVQIEGDSAVLQVPIEKLVGLHQTVYNPNELRNRDIFAAPRKLQMDALDVTYGGSVLKLRKMPTGVARETFWVVYDAAGKGTVAKSSEVDAMLTELTKPRAAREVLSGDQAAAFADKEKKATVKIWLDGIPSTEKVTGDQIPAEPKLNGTPLELTFGKKDGEVVFLRKVQSGQTIDFKVPESLLQSFSRGRLDLLDAKLKTFSTTAVTSMLFYRGKELFEVTKKDKLWSFGSPTNLKGLPASENRTLALVGLFSSLYSDRVVAEATSPEELKKYGVDPNTPRMKIYLTLNDESNKSLTYDIGFETEDQKFVYARQTGSNYIVTIPKAIFDRLNSDDLRELTLQKVDTTLATKIKIRGWKGVNGPTITELVLEKKDNNWVAISPPSPANLSISNVKVEQLLLLLKVPQIESIAGDLKPEFNFDVTKSLDALEITVESGEKLPPVTLTLGAKVDPAKSYATSSAYAGGKVAVIIDAGGLRQTLSKPTDLAK